MTAFFQIKGRLFGKRTIVRYAERSMIIGRLDRSSSRRGVYFRFPDWQEMAIWRNHLDAGSLFIDVGANVGLYTIMALECKADVISIEPVCYNAEQLEENLRLNGYKATVLRFAIGSHTADAINLSGPDFNRISIRGDTSNDKANTNFIKTAVPLRTLDTIIGDRLVAGVKIDVEGAERLVLEGSQKALAEKRIALLQIEWNSAAMHCLGEDRKPVADILRNFGYEIGRPCRDGTLRPVEDTGIGPDMFAWPKK
jgi:FkbM family methyltransferase